MIRHWERQRERRRERERERETERDREKEKEFPGVLELVSFEGNVTLKDSTPFVHSHVVLSDHEMNLHWEDEKMLIKKFTI